VKLLNGGFLAWKTIEGEIDNLKPTVTVSSFKLYENPSMKYYVSKEEMLSAVKNNTFILDTRTTNEFTGKRHKKGAFKGGRIPNSKLIDWADAVEYHDTKKFKSKEQLNQIYNRLKLSKEDEIIVYCHSGVRSAHTTFVLTQLLGYKNVKNYDGSWTEWSYFNDLPFKQDSITTIKN
jgi:thiosulfate/3-mercaptopyruvate sulfurtransferase